jgi:hypothetical protein
MLVRIEPLKSFIAARSLLSSIEATTILTRRASLGAFTADFAAWRPHLRHRGRTHANKRVRAK